MKTKPNQFTLTLIITLIMVIALLMIARLTNIRLKDSFNNAAGILTAGLCTLCFQRIMVTDWVYRWRFVLQGVALCSMVLLMSLFEFINGNHPFKLDILLFSLALGLAFGVIYWVSSFLVFTRRKRSIPYSGLEKPILLSKATLWDSQLAIYHGFAILLSDRLQFLGTDSKIHEVLFSEINSIEIQIALFFPFMMDLHLKGGEKVSVAVSMPYIWKKKIEMAMNFNLVKLG